MELYFIYFLFLIITSKVSSTTEGFSSPYSSKDFSTTIILSKYEKQKTNRQDLNYRNPLKNLGIPANTKNFVSERLGKHSLDLMNGEDIQAHKANIRRRAWTQKYHTINTVRMPGQLPQTYYTRTPKTLPEGPICNSGNKQVGAPRICKHFRRSILNAKKNSISHLDLIPFKYSKSVILSAKEADYSSPLANSNYKISSEIPISKENGAELWETSVVNEGSIASPESYNQNNPRVRTNNSLLTRLKSSRNFIPRVFTNFGQFGATTTSTTPPLRPWQMTCCPQNLNKLYNEGTENTSGNPWKCFVNTCSSEITQVNPSSNGTRPPTDATNKLKVTTTAKQNATVSLNETNFPATSLQTANTSPMTPISLQTDNTSLTTSLQINNTSLTTTSLPVPISTQKKFKQGSLIALAITAKKINVTSKSPAARSTTSSLKTNVTHSVHRVNNKTSNKLEPTYSPGYVNTTQASKANITKSINSTARGNLITKLADTSKNSHMKKFSGETQIITTVKSFLSFKKIRQRLFPLDTSKVIHFREKELQNFNSQSPRSMFHQELEIDNTKNKILEKLQKERLAHEFRESRSPSIFNEQENPQLILTNFLRKPNSRKQRILFIPQESKNQKRSAHIDFFFIKNGQKCKTENRPNTIKPCKIKYQNAPFYNLTSFLGPFYKPMRGKKKLVMCCSEETIPKKKVTTTNGSSNFKISTATSALTNNASSETTNATDIAAYNISATAQYNNISTTVNEYLNNTTTSIDQTIPTLKMLGVLQVTKRKEISQDKIVRKMDATSYLTQMSDNAEVFNSSSTYQGGSNETKGATKVEPSIVNAVKYVLSSTNMNVDVNNLTGTTSAMVSNKNTSKLPAHSGCEMCNQTENTRSNYELLEKSGNFGKNEVMHRYNKDSLYPESLVQSHFLENANKRLLVNLGNILESKKLKNTTIIKNAKKNLGKKHLNKSKNKEESTKFNGIHFNKNQCNDNSYRQKRNTTLVNKCFKPSDMVYLAVPSMMFRNSNVQASDNKVPQKTAIRSRSIFGQLLPCCIGKSVKSKDQEKKPWEEPWTAKHDGFQLYNDDFQANPADLHKAELQFLQSERPTSAIRSLSQQNFVAFDGCPAICPTCGSKNNLKSLKQEDLNFVTPYPTPFISASPKQQEERQSDPIHCGSCWTYVLNYPKDVTDKIVSQNKAVTTMKTLKFIETYNSFPKYYMEIPEALGDLIKRTAVKCSDVQPVNCTNQPEIIFERKGKMMKPLSSQENNDQYSDNKKLKKQPVFLVLQPYEVSRNKMYLSMSDLQNFLSGINQKQYTLRSTTIDSNDDEHLLCDFPTSSQYHSSAVEEELTRVPIALIPAYIPENSGNNQVYDNAFFEMIAPSSGFNGRMSKNKLNGNPETDVSHGIPNVFKQVDNRVHDYNIRRTAAMPTGKPPYLVIMHDSPCETPYIEFRKQQDIQKNKRAEQNGFDVTPRPNAEKFKHVRAPGVSQTRGTPKYDGVRDIP